ncbi:MAG: polyprenyl synthetase family protein [Bacteroidota bacterium]
MGKSLADIKAPIKEEIASFESHFRAAMKSDVALLDKVLYYIVQRKGKQVRPVFVFLCAKICGPIVEKTYNAASLIELLHTASLVHDDVVDDSYERRSMFSINALWKNKIAVLIGDYMFSQGMLLALNNDALDIFKIISKAMTEIVEGELLQIEKARKLNIKEDIYFEIIRQKTATLIAASCSAGAASTTDDAEIIEKFRLFGEKIGIAFQIKDDLFDFGFDNVGKPTGIDIKEKKMTLPLIYALNHTDRPTRRKMMNIVKRHNEDKRKVAEVIDFVRNSGGMEYANEKMLAYQKEALDILATLPESDSKASLIDLVHFITERKN